MVRYYTIQGTYKKILDPNLYSETEHDINITAYVRTASEYIPFFFVAKMNWKDERGVGVHNKLEYKDEILGSLLEKVVNEPNHQSIKKDRTEHAFKFASMEFYQEGDFEGKFFFPIQKIIGYEENMALTKRNMIEEITNYEKDQEARLHGTIQNN